MKSKLVMALALLTAFAVIMACSSKPVAETGDTVKVHYTGKLDDGTIFDSSEGQEPLEFKLGDAMVIPGFEKALIGMSVGDSATVTIPPDSAYGPYRDEMIGVVPKAQIQGAENLMVGQELQLPAGPNGEVFYARVLEVMQDSVKLDANHPLAGQTLNFAIRLVDVQKPE
jgi:peptidylprolyl isomerase